MQNSCFVRESCCFHPKAFDGLREAHPHRGGFFFSHHLLTVKLCRLKEIKLLVIKHEMGSTLCRKLFLDGRDQFQTRWA